ncbi:CPSF3 [Cordylochernes scorpioides]|uniref:CPSF3 n=1 Tax=Cordylochernes scorpioides TaxID=51811 RepID=A0ABY6KU46_9ARAC|nr:CPSF3 [Cordylochernes scorpioides]
MKYDRRTHLEEFQIDDLVWCKNFRGGDKWIPGKIVGKKGTRVYTILIHGQVMAYHRDQIRKRWRNGEEDESGDGERQPEHSREAGPSAIISEDVRDREVQSDTDDGKSLEPLRSLDPEAMREEGPVLRRNPPRARRPPCMAVYQTYVNAMNDRIKKQIAISNPFVFKHISNLKSIDHFEDIGPCVVMASPGMMQSGLSRELFESWCTEPKNGVIIAGYCVEGTLAKHILTEPEEITTMTGQKLPLKISVNYISFSAHTDYRQTSEFINKLKPPHIVLVHGEQNEMNRLKTAIIREYEDEPDVSIEVHNPRNMEMEKPNQGKRISGILVKRNFNYYLLAPKDLSKYTAMIMSTVSQRMSVHYGGTYDQLYCLLYRIAGNVEILEVGGGRRAMRVFRKVTVILEGQLAILEWNSSPTNDMLANNVIVVILNADRAGMDKALPPKMDKTSYVEYMMETLTDMYGEDAVSKEGDETLQVTVRDKVAHVNLKTLDVACEDEALQQNITMAISRLNLVLTPVRT